MTVEGEGEHQISIAQVHRMKEESRGLHRSGLVLDAIEHLLARVEARLRGLEFLMPRYIQVPVVPERQDRQDVYKLRCPL